MTLQNLHTHCTFCDGKNTAEEVVKTAIEKGFSSIGFSSHSYMDFSSGVGLRPEIKPDYLKELERLKNKYYGIIDIYKGIEFEMLSYDDFKGYDYTIGSCHFFEFDGEKVNFDTNQEELSDLINTRFGGNVMKMAKEYYRLVACLPEYHKFDIVGHFDIIAKHCEKIPGFDITSKEYLDFAKEAAVALCQKIKIFEINTGCIARDYRTFAYPQKEILKEIKAHGGSVTVSSDCHRREFLDVGFKDAYKLAKECGFNEIMIFNGKEFVPEPICI